MLMGLDEENWDLIEEEKMEEEKKRKEKKRKGTWKHVVWWSGGRDVAKLEAMLEFGARQGELVHAKKVLR